MNHREALARANLRFRVRVAPLPAFTRNEIAALIDAYARELEPVDIDRSRAIHDLAELLRVALNERPSPTVIHHNEPDEDDDKMRELRARVRGG